MHWKWCMKSEQRENKGLVVHNQQYKPEKIQLTIFQPQSLRNSPVGG